MRQFFDAETRFDAPALTELNLDAAPSLTRLDDGNLDQSSFNVTPLSFTALPLMNGLAFFGEAFANPNPDLAIHFEDQLEAYAQADALNFDASVLVCSGCSHCNTKEQSSNEGSDGANGAKADGPQFGPNPADDTVPDDATTTEVITLGEFTTGEVQTGGDHDWYQITLVAGETYHIHMMANGDGFSATQDPLLRLYGTDGTSLLLENDDVIDPTDPSNTLHRSAQLIYEATETGTYYVSAQGWVQPNGVQTSGEFAILAFEEGNAPDLTLDEMAYFLTNQYSPRQQWAGGVVEYYIGNMSAAVQALIVAAFDLWDDVANLTFTAVAEADAELTFIDTDDGAYSSSSTINTNVVSSVINVSQSQWIDVYGTDIDSYSFQTYVHEIGHTLGLGHQGPYNGSANFNSNGIFERDSWAYSIMSYFDQQERGDGDYNFVLTPQMVDIIAIQDIYGANTTTRNTDSVYFSNSNVGGIFDFSQFNGPQAVTVYDTGGVDTLDTSDYNQNAIVTLVETEFSSFGNEDNVTTIARGSVIENIISGNGADTLTGNAASNEITGGGGNDVIEGGLGTDYALYSGASAANYTITDNGNGTFTVTDNVGSDGTDTLSGIEFVRIGGVDTQLGAPTGGGGGATEGADTLDGTAGDDTIDGLGGDDIINGFAGNDVLIGGAGADTLNGGGGTDWARYEGSSAGVDINLTTGVSIGGDAQGDSFDSIENLRGSALADSLEGDSNANRLEGEGGNDVILGRAGNDRLQGGGGVDDLNGGGGNDQIFGGSGNDIINASSGDDRIWGGDGADSIIGGSGRDRVEYSDSSAGLTIDLSDSSNNTGIAAGDTYTTVEDARGSNFDDTLIGDGGVNYLFGIDGDDTIFGEGGQDRIYGGDGVDTLLGGAAGDIIEGGNGNDNIVGESGFDRLFGDGGDDTINGGAENDFISGGDGNDTLIGGTGNDRFFGGDGADSFDGGDGVDRVDYSTATGAVAMNLALGGIIGEAAGDTFTSIEWVYGSDFGDSLGMDDQDGGRLYGRQGNDSLFGGAGQDRLYGQADDDNLVGNGGIDRLYGQDGNDTLDGGTDNDQLFGGSGADVFVFAAGYDADTIYDFQDGIDLIDVTTYTEAQVNNAIANIATVGASVRLDFGNGDTLMLRATDAADISLADFITQPGAVGAAREPAPLSMESEVFSNDDIGQMLKSYAPDSAPPMIGDFNGDDILDIMLPDDIGYSDFG